MEQGRPKQDRTEQEAFMNCWVVELHSPWVCADHRPPPDSRWCSSAGRTPDRKRRDERASSRWENPSSANILHARTRILQHHRGDASRLLGADSRFMLRESSRPRGGVHPLALLVTVVVRCATPEEWLHWAPG